MRDITDILMRRSTPGTLIFDENGELLFCNSEALELIATNPSLEKDARTLCDRVKVSSGVSSGRKAFHLSALIGDGPPHYAMRAFMVGKEDRTQKHVMVLLEKIVERRSIDMEGAKTKFQLSKRELEVLTALNEGLSSKAISERLFISQFTVKDHIRNIMRKAGVNSRAALIAALQ